MTSYHVHTLWSDGQAPMEDVIAAAEEMGLDELGISDHFVILPGSVRVDWSMGVEDLPRYVAEVRERAASAKVTVRLGIEVDYIPETLGQTLTAINGIPFDYIIGSVHYIDGFPVDGHRRYWDALTQEEIDETWRAYYRRVRDMVRARYCDIVAHFDLPKKFGHLPAADVSAEALEALDAVAEAGLVLEINTSGWHQLGGEVYPAPWILSEAYRRDIPLVITADAHHPRNLTRDFDRATELALKAGYRTVTRFEGRRRTQVALEEVSMSDT